MGYDLHITRKAEWVDDEGPTISLAEWQQLIERDAELAMYQDVGDRDRGKVASYQDQRGALWWDDGEIRTKNPDKPLVIKMVTIAQELGATVQGDDGEIYREDGTSHQPVRQKVTGEKSLFARFASWLRVRRLTRELQAEVPKFKVGLRVRDSSGRRGVVTEVNRRAEYGAGRVSVRYDDGHESCVAYIASGLELDDGSIGEHDVSA